VVFLHLHILANEQNLQVTDQYLVLLRLILLLIGNVLTTQHQLVHILVLQEKLAPMVHVQHLHILANEQNLQVTQQYLPLLRLILTLTGYVVIAQHQLVHIPALQEKLAPMVHVGVLTIWNNKIVKYYNDEA